MESKGNIEENKNSILRINEIKMIEKGIRVSTERTREERQLFIEKIQNDLNLKKKQYPEQDLFVEIKIDSKNDHDRSNFKEKTKELDFISSPLLKSQYGVTYKCKILGNQIDQFESHMKSYLISPNQDFLDDVIKIEFINNSIETNLPQFLSLNLSNSNSREIQQPSQNQITDESFKILIKLNEQMEKKEIQEILQKKGICALGIECVEKIQEKPIEEKRDIEIKKQEIIREEIVKSDSYLVKITRDEYKQLPKISHINAIIPPKMRRDRLFIAKSLNFYKIPILLNSDSIIQSRFLVIDEDYTRKGDNDFEPIINADDIQHPNVDIKLKEGCITHGEYISQLISQGIYERNCDHPEKEIPLCRGYFISGFDKILFDETQSELDFVTKSGEMLKIQIESIIDQDPNVKIVNISLAFNESFERNDKQLEIAKIIDHLCLKYRNRIIFIVCTGQLTYNILQNHGINPKHLTQFQTEIADKLPNSLMDPATSPFAIVIGNVHSVKKQDLSSFQILHPVKQYNYDTFSSIKRDWSIDILTRKGPTIFQIPKPDFVSGFVKNDNMIDTNFPNSTMKITETSFNCARVARDILLFWNRNQNLNAQEIIALLISNSNTFQIDTGLNKLTPSKQNEVIHNNIGYGLIEFQEFYSPEKYTVFLVGTKEISQTQIGYLEIPIPEEILKEDIEKYFVFGISYVTPVNLTSQKKYLPYYVSVELYNGDEERLKIFWETGDKLDKKISYSNEFNLKDDPQIQYNLRNPHKRFHVQFSKRVENKLYLKFTIEGIDALIGTESQSVSIGIKFTIPKTKFDLKTKIQNYISQIDQKNIFILEEEKGTTSKKVTLQTKFDLFLQK